MMKFNKIRITQHRKEEKRLTFVKALKEVSGYGLKEAKDTADSLNWNFDKTINLNLSLTNQDTKKCSTIEITLPGSTYAGTNRTNGEINEDIKRFIKVINEDCTGSYVVTGGTEWEREMKLLSLGLGTDSDYVNFITSMIMSRNIDGIEVFIHEHLSTLDRENLEKIYNKIIKE